jgi:hypothetical protein
MMCAVKAVRELAARNFTLIEHSPIIVSGLKMGPPFAAGAQVREETRAG